MLARRLLLGVTLLALPGLAPAADVPVAGDRVVLKNTPKRRTVTIDLSAPGIVAPFPDPTQGASLLVSGGATPGQCRAEIALDPAGWTPIAGAGAGRGYRYRKPAPGTQGVRRISLHKGKVSIRTEGTGWPCDLAAANERVPLTVELRVAGSRYCAAVDTPAVLRNEAGRFRARHASAPAACPKTDLTVATLNILHGSACDAPTANCRLADRVALFFQWVVARGCPDVVTIQEVSSNVAAIVPGYLSGTCPFTYQLVFQPTFNVDDEMILSRYPVVTSGLQKLQLGFRNVLFARIDHPIGPVDVFSTHLASSSDGATQPCTNFGCPPECAAEGPITVRQCQAVQAANYVLAQHTVATPAVLTGDFNDSPGTFTYDRFTMAHPWIDTHLAAGNPECDPMTGSECTSGRIDDDLSQLESPAINENERIDYIFLVPPTTGSICSATLDSPTDSDGDGTGTRLFANAPNPFSPMCGATPDPICWPSDHEGAELDLDCN